MATTKSNPPSQIWFHGLGPCRPVPAILLVQIWVAPSSLWRDKCSLTHISGTAPLPGRMQHVQAWHTCIRGEGVAQDRAVKLTSHMHLSAFFVCELLQWWRQFCPFKSKCFHQCPLYWRDWPSLGGRSGPYVCSMPHVFSKLLHHGNSVLVLQGQINHIPIGLVLINIAGMDCNSPWCGFFSLTIPLQNSPQ